MSGRRRHRSWGRWLLIAGVLFVAGGATVAVLGVQAEADAVDDFDTARARLETALGAEADAEARLAETQAARETAGIQAEGADALLTARSVALVEVEAALSAAEAEAEAYLDAGVAVIAQAAAPLAFQEDMLGLRRDQLGAVAANDFDAFNELQGAFNAVLANASREVAAFGRLLSALPTGGSDYRPVGSSPQLDLVIDPPTGPAVITATAPDTVRCRVAGNSGCEYRLTVTFTGTNTLEATVERIAVRWIERGGNRWWFDADGEWQDKALVIPADGTVTYTDFIWTDADDEMRRIMGGTVRLRYNGTDAEGNRFSGTINATLERPE